MLLGLEDQAADNADQAHDRADREIDAAGQDDRGHAQRHDADEGEIARDVVQIVSTGERVRLQPRHHGADRKQGHRHPERLAAEQPLESGPLLEAGDILDLDAAVKRAGILHRSASHASRMAPVMRPVTSSGELDAISLSATLVPRRITATRSHTAKTSGMRWLMRMTAIF